MSSLPHPVFSKPVAEIALGMTLSILRNIHNAHFDFVKGKEKYGLKSNLNASLLANKKIGLLCLLYTSPSPRDRSLSRMPSSA